MRSMALRAAVFMMPLLFISGCYCPLLAKAGYEKECEGSMIDSLDAKSYRLSRIERGMSKGHSITLNISRDDCSIRVPDDFISMGIVGLHIEKPRSVKKGAMVLVITDPDPVNKGKTMECRAPISDTDPMVFSCPEKAGDVRYLLQP